MMSRLFPPEFILGCATSSYQIEGATNADGRGESIWDRFARKPGAIHDGSDGSVACEHHRLFETDVAILAELGVHSYRFSIAWPRIMPQGRGPVCQQGLDFYERLVDALLAANIRPFVTLYHWDLPQALDDEGGWLSRDTARAFADYAGVVARTLGDRVTDWITHNEPWCVSVLGYEQGEHAPGHKSVPEMLVAAHHVLLSHGLAVPRIRSHTPGARVGITLNACPGQPASISDADVAACRLFDGLFNRWYFDPIFGRGYPGDVVAHHRSTGHLPEDGLPFVEKGDLEAIAVETDFVGINYYSRAIVRDEALPDEENAPRTVHRAPASEDTDMGWEVYPEGLYDTLTRVHEDYGPRAIYITECGAAYGDAPSGAGGVADARRVKFLGDHFIQTRRALDAGVPVQGFFVWSLLDNFEWAYGYTKRFGIVWVDYASQKRIIKDSGHWLRRVIANNTLDEISPASAHEPETGSKRRGAP